MEKEHKKEHEHKHEHHAEPVAHKKACCSSPLPIALGGIVVGIIIGALIVGALATPAQNPTQPTAFAPLTKEAVGDKTIKYLNDNYLTKQGMIAKLTSVSQYGNALYSVSVDVLKGTESQGTNEFIVTQDGNLLIIPANVLNLNETVIPNPTQPADNTAQTSSYKDVQKSDSAMLDAFVVSNCPFGLQMQRILAPIATGLAANIKVRYIGEIVDGKITAMHGDEEAQENLLQICIREEQGTKYWQYVSEYIKKGDSTAALTAASIDTAKLSACISDSKKGLKYAQEDFSLASAGQVGSSPTLFLNGTEASEFEFAQDHNVSQNNARSADNVKNLLCYGFNKAPAACNTALAKDSANTGLAETYSGGSTSGGNCGP